MNPLNHTTLADQRLALCEKLAAQRGEISQQIKPIDSVDSEFPRSVTMRILIHQPELAARLVTQLVALLAEPESGRAIIVRMLLTRMVLALATAANHYCNQIEHRRGPQQIRYK